MDANHLNELGFQGTLFDNDMLGIATSRWSNDLMLSYVLVVDDDPDAQEVLVDVVRDLGLVAKSAGDGAEALTAVKQNPPALILLDLMMPNLDGFGFYSRLRAVRETRYIPVIVVTACEREQVDMLRLPGVVDVVQKGQFSVSDFASLISETLGQGDSLRGSTGIRPAN